MMQPDLLNMIKWRPNRQVDSQMRAKIYEKAKSKRLLPQEQDENQLGGGNQKRQNTKCNTPMKSVDINACLNYREKGHFKRDCSKNQQGVLGGGQGQNQQQHQQGQYRQPQLPVAGKIHLAYYVELIQSYPPISMFKHNQLIFQLCKHGLVATCLWQ